MRAVQYLVYRFLTVNEYYNLYKPPDAVPGGGGQRYIDFPTSAVSIGKWRRFFHGVPNVTETLVTNGPQWEFPVLSVGIPFPQAPVMATVYQRRDSTVCL